VLGLWDGHDAGVALVADGELVFALSEERPRRQKRSSGFPSASLALAVAWAERAGLPIGRVAVAGRHGRAPLRLAEPWYARGDPHRDPLTVASALVRGWENLVPGWPLVRDADRLVGLAALGPRLSRALGGLPGVSLVAHHEAHAHAARLAARGVDDTWLLTWDAYGEGVAATLRPAMPGAAPLATLPVSAGVAFLYGAVTVLLGFREGDEGKLMGLAAAGAVEPALQRFLGLFRVAADGSPALDGRLTAGRLRRCLAGLRRDDVAAGLQAATERLVTDWLRVKLQGATRPVRLALAGGLFANIRLNQALAEVPGVAGVSVFPHMGDGGLAAGAAAAAWSERAGEPVRRAVSMYLGQVFDDPRIEAAVRAAGLPWRRLEHPEVRAAERLLSGQIIARYDGRDEYGPRALGNRSILFDAARPELIERLNRALHRDGFMPFAPSVLAEQADGLWSPLGATDLGTMTVSVAASERFRALCPAAVHLDGTCRPQVVEASANPGYHAVLREVWRRSGRPAVVNTSFNLHGEPIVHTPEDALATFRAAGLEALYLGDLEVRRPDVA
jgi:carbamoyltransferase